MTRRVKWLASVGLVAALALGTAAGVVTSASARAKPHVVASAVVSAPVTSAAFTFTASVKGIGKGLGTVSLAGSGQVDLVNDAGSLSVTLPASVAALIPGGPAGPETVDVVLSSGTVYVEVPALAALLGEPWISVALPSSDSAAIPGIFTEVGGALGNVDEILSFAKSHHVSVHSAGSSNVDGTAVTGSRVTARLQGLHIAATLWADASGRVIQALVRVGGGRGLAVSAVVNFSGYDAPVTVTVPPSSEVRAIPLSVVTSVLGGLLHHGRLGL